ncbi:hypothetical protein C4D60_Mb04t29530 [Musa balbisiana]|uniref:CHCH domain-containing protein n=1 Tax=Musa balbisiana TaxID=52838 RepID=A0A4S8KFJ4_MUSBA|nr:hypothetical protein C4D60_Mb04t29530 [Musa balbisiana]
MPRRSSGGRSAPRAARRPAPVRNPPQPAHQAPPPAPVQGGGSILGGIGSTIAQGYDVIYLLFHFTFCILNLWIDLAHMGCRLPGVAFGTGSAVAHRAVDAVMGPRTFQHETIASEAPTAAAPANPVNYAGTDACSIHSKAFQDCINNYGSDISKCQFYLDMLNECRRGSGAA